MARLVSTTSTYGAPAKAATLKALQERQEALLRQQAQQQPGQQPIVSPWQGVAQLAQQFATGRQLKKAEAQEAEGRAQLAQTMAGIDYSSGATPDQVAAISQLDPEAGQRMLESAMRLRQEQAQLADTRAYNAGLTADERGYQERQNAATSAAATSAEAAKNAREQQEEAKRDARELEQEIEKEKRTAEAAKMRDMTPEEIAARPGLDPKKAYQIDPKGTIKPVGGEGQTINVGGELPGGMKKLGEKEGEMWNSFQEQGNKAGASMGDIATLEELSKVAPQGPVVGALVQRFPGISTSGAAFQSVIKRVAPTLRAPGSGATSDIEYQGMLDSLPALSNRPEANRMILEIMKNKASLDMERGDVIDQIANGDIDQKEGRKRLKEINRRSVMPPALKGMIEQEEERAKGGKEGGKTAGPKPIEELTDEELDALEAGG